MSGVVLEPDEVEVPSKLGMPVPLLPWPWPLDWTIRQVYVVMLAMLVAMAQIAAAASWADWLWAGLWAAGGLLFVVLDYNLRRPSLEARLLRRLRYYLLLGLALPGWHPRRLGGRLPVGPGREPRLVPGALARRVHANVRVDDDGIVHVPGMIEPLRAVVEVSPQANPDLLPMGDREAILRRRLQILRSLQHAYSAGVRVRPAEPERLALAAGASARWVRESFAPGLAY